AVVVPEVGEPIEATYAEVDEEGVAALRLASPVGPATVTLELDYSAPFDRTLKGLYRVDEAGESYAFTQFEAISARQAFPSFDEPRFKTPFDMSLTVKEAGVALANTQEVRTEPLEGGLKRVLFART